MAGPIAIAKSGSAGASGETPSRASAAGEHLIFFCNRFPVLLTPLGARPVTGIQARCGTQALADARGPGEPRLLRRDQAVDFAAIADIDVRDMV